VVLFPDEVFTALSGFLSVGNMRSGDLFFAKQGKFFVFFFVVRLLSDISFCCVVESSNLPLAGTKPDKLLPVCFDKKYDRKEAMFYSMCFIGLYN